MPDNQVPRVAFHITGKHKDEAAAAITRTLAQAGVALIALEQRVLFDHLLLSGIAEGLAPKLSSTLSDVTTRLGLTLDVEAVALDQGSACATAKSRLCVTLLGDLADGNALARLCGFLEKGALPPQEIRCLSDSTMSGLELFVDMTKVGSDDGPLLRQLRSGLLQLGSELGVDLAVQQDNVFRKNRRLVCMDVDSTFVRGELIDELAELVGCKAEVAAITARAMRGELDFPQALKERVALLKGLPLARAREVTEHLELMPGAREFVATLKNLGFRVGLVSGGFTFFVSELQRRFDLDFAFANELEVEGGELTGRVQGPIVDAARKAEVLREMASKYQLRLEQTVAVGDGANDLLMLEAAGLGIAFRAKPKLQASAHMSVNHHESLDTLLFLMGYSSRDLRELAT